MRALLFLLSVLLLGSVVSAAGIARGPYLDGWNPIKNLTDFLVQDSAIFAVSEHNKEAGSHLKLIRVVSGEQQVVSGIKYRLLIEVSGKANYKAFVWVQPWKGFRKLLSFIKI